MQDFEQLRNQTPPAPPAPPPGFTPEMQRGLSMAILQARPGCCPTCDKLQPLQVLLFDQMDARGPLPPSMGMNAAGEWSESPPIERPTWPEAPGNPHNPPQITPALSH